MKKSMSANFLTVQEAKLKAQISSQILSGDPWRLKQKEDKMI